MTACGFLFRCIAHSDDCRCREYFIPDLVVRFVATQVYACLVAESSGTLDLALVLDGRCLSLVLAAAMAFLAGTSYVTIYEAVWYKNGMGAVKQLCLLTRG